MGWIQISFGVYNPVVHFEMSRKHQAWKAPVRAFFSTALAGELVRKAQSAGIDPRLDRLGSGPVIVGQNWTEDRVYYRGLDELPTSIPSQWTDLVPQDPFVVMAAGRSHFRADDLVELARLIKRLEP